MNVYKHSVKTAKQIQLFCELHGCILLCKHPSMCDNHDAHNTAKYTVCTRCMVVCVFSFETWFDVAFFESVDDAHEQLIHEEQRKHTLSMLHQVCL